MNDQQELDNSGFADQVSATPLNEVRADLADLRREVASLVKPPGPPALVTVKDVAKALAVSVRSVEELIASRELTPIWIRGARRFDPRAIQAFIRSRPAVKRPRNYVVSQRERDDG